MADTWTMEVSAAPERTIAWVCPECGHGSPEPRDQVAHLDAHRQLQQFFRAWDEAVATDARADTSTGFRHRARGFWGVVALAVVCIAALVLAGLAGGDRGAPSRTTAAGVPVPGVDLPRSTASTVAAEPTTPPPTSPATVQGPAGTRAARQGTRQPSSTAAVPDDVSIPPVAASPASMAGPVTPGEPVPTAPPASTARPSPMVRACLLGVCITVS